MDRLNILSLLGLSLRGGRLAVGEEPVEAVARARDARVLLLASDAADNTARRVRRFPPYFSPKMAIAPIFLACPIGIARLSSNG